ncbi:SDR family oxidoreductase [Microtetraspora malaysiensis]|uniref:SDR family oxidoreductase n=1 Tax=Microtetraspora malaysiensis TaxID=161358 RepID=UPI003D8D8F26
MNTYRRARSNEAAPKDAGEKKSEPSRRTRRRSVPSKAALLSVSKSPATSLGAAGVRSNVVSPGPTRTALFDAPGGFADQVAGRSWAQARFVRERHP